MKTAIIGGTGLEQLPESMALAPVEVTTPYGTVELTRLQTGTKETYFLSRHGANHQIPPHRINYRANTAALQSLGVRRVLATNAVGALRADLPAGSLLLLSDFIDFSRREPRSFHGDEHVVHTDFTEPYCPALRASLLTVADDLATPLHPEGVYLCVDGPRFETPAEVRLFARWGADVVGMTGLPEAVYAREAGLCYAAVAIVTNPGAGLSTDPVDHLRVTNAMASMAGAVRALLLEAAHRAPTTACHCGG